MQKDNADVLSELFLKEKNSIDKVSIIETIQTSTSTPFLIPYSEVVSSEKEISTASKEYQTVLRLTTPSISDGKYKISWYFETIVDKKGEVECQVKFDDKDELFKIKSKEDELEMSSGFKYKNMSEGVHTIDINFKVKKGTATIKMTTIEITKIT